MVTITPIGTWLSALDFFSSCACSASNVEINAKPIKRGESFVNDPN